ncbi:MAG: MG2 domain-containing protein, partial [Spirochaetes bacterium]|nr:MG2 domain-containing protein [Spirochaetota bacterium]
MRNIFSILFIILLLFMNCSKKSDELLSKKDISESMQNYKRLKLDTKLDISGSTISYYDASAIDTSAFEVIESDEPFTIVDYGPIDEAPHENKRPTIYVVFSQPVVPIAKLGAPVKQSEIMKLEPAVEGTFRWYGTKLLSFEPDEDVLPQHEYQVTIDPDLQSLGGKKLEGKKAFSFHTEYLRILKIQPDYHDVPPEEAKKIQVTFSYPVNLDIIKKYIEIDAQGATYPFQISRPEKEDWMDEDYLARTVQLNVNKKFAENVDVKVRLLKGARSEAEFLGTPEEKYHTFGTLRPFQYLGYDTYSYSFPRSEKGDSNPIYLEFTHPVTEESAKKNISISLPVDNLADHIEVWHKYVKISNLPVEYDSTYVLSINRGLTDIYGRKLGIDKNLSIYIPDAYAYYHFPNRGTRILEAQFEPKIIYEYQNIFSGNWDVQSIEDPYQSLTSTLKPYDFSQLPKNTKHYEILDLSPWLNAEGKGFVGLAWNFDEKQRKWARTSLQIQVTDLAVTTRYGYNKIIAWVNSLSTGQPINGAKVTLINHNQVQKEAKTDKQGLAIFELNPNEFQKVFYNTYKDQYKARIRVEYGNDKLEFKPNNTHNPYHFGVYTTSNGVDIQKPRPETFIFTDRGLYKPGETVTFRGIDRDLLLGEYSIYRGDYTLEVKSTRYRAKPFYTDAGVTTESGGFHGKVTLADDIEPGYYKISYKRGKYEKSVQFQVAHFRRLNFQVKMSQPDFTSYMNDKISASVQATYLAGGALSGGSYEYYWSRYSVYYSPPGNNWQAYEFGPAQYDDFTVLDNGKGTLDTSGKATVNQQTNSRDVKKGMTYNYEASIRVEDIDRQIIQGNQSVLVHPAAFYIGAKFRSEKKGWWSPFVEKGQEATVEYALV